MNGMGWGVTWVALVASTAPAQRNHVAHTRFAALVAPIFLPLFAAFQQCTHLLPYCTYRFEDEVCPSSQGALLGVGPYPGSSSGQGTVGQDLLAMRNLHVVP